MISRSNMGTCGKDVWVSDRGRLFCSLINSLIVLEG